MVLRYRVKRCRFVSILAILGIMVFVSAIFTRITQTQQLVLAADAISNPGSGLPEQPPEPQACLDDEQQNSQDQQQGTSDQERLANEQRHDNLIQQINALTAQLSDETKTAEEKQSIQAQIDTLRAQATALESQASQSNGTPSSQPSSTTHEPSAACKAAIVSSSQSNLGQYKSIINDRIYPTLDRVASISDTVEASIPHFREIGVPEATITQIQTDIATMSTSSTTLRSFFENVSSKIDTFLAQLSDPNAAFSGMKNGFSVSDQNAAVKAGDDLVAAFSDLQTLIDSIKE